MAKEIIQAEGPEEHCWINIFPPFNHQNLKKLSERLDVPLDYFIDSLDIDERAYFEKDDNLDFIVIKTPINNFSDNEFEPLYITIPIGIIITQKIIITISAAENPVINSFLNNQVKHFNPADKSKFVLQLFDRNVYYFLHYLKEINNQRNVYEKELYNSMRNSELKRLLNIEKSLVYFVNSIRSNELLMMKIQRMDFLNLSKKEEEKDLFSDIILDNSQALEMANIYTNILSGTMDAFASIISNNLNFVMKRLTSVTIVLMVPTLVASLFGMNVALPMGNSPYAFIFIIIISILLSVTLVWFFLRKKWF